jgi:hypothetical protein
MKILINVLMMFCPTSQLFEELYFCGSWNFSLKILEWSCLVCLHQWRYVVNRKCSRYCFFGYLFFFSSVYMLHGSNDVESVVSEDEIQEVIFFSMFICLVPCLKNVLRPLRIRYAMNLSMKRICCEVVWASAIPGYLHSRNWRMFVMVQLLLFVQLSRWSGSGLHGQTRPQCGVRVLVLSRGYTSAPRLQRGITSDARSDLVHLEQATRTQRTIWMGRASREHLSFILSSPSTRPWKTRKLCLPAVVLR